jgi:hypothetical protein
MFTNKNHTTKTTVLRFNETDLKKSGPKKFDRLTSMGWTLPSGRPLTGDAVIIKGNEIKLLE